MKYEFFQIGGDLSSEDAEGNVVKLLDRLEDGFKIISAVSIVQGVQYILEK
jgi:hypothetical protein